MMEESLEIFEKLILALDLLFVIISAWGENAENLLFGSSVLLNDTSRLFLQASLWQSLLLWRSGM
jgi:hypothetical protein